MEEEGDTLPLPGMQIQAYKDEQRDEKVLQWGNSFQFSTPPVTQTNPRKGTPGIIRARWSNNARYNPTKMKRPNTLDLPVTNMDMTDSDKAKCHFQSKCAKDLDLCVSFASNLLSIPHPRIRQDR